ncbi:MAG TPA: ABC transporter permease [Candidatus Faecousia intestinigallinarum]|nr:ABC transporter permease [Candidatus Faecousia intestinigallinarum]
MERKSPLLKRDATKTILASIISILIGLVLGALIVFIVSLTNDSISVKGGLEGIALVFFGVFSTGRNAAGALTFGFNPQNWGNLLFRAMPLMMTGLSVAVAFKTGLFNIGAPGQYLMGTAATLFTALCIPTSVVPAWLVWILALLAGMLAGAVWGAIPGILKATRNINEVLACIMTNWIAANLVTMVFDMAEFMKNAEEAGKVAYVKKTIANGVATSKMGLDVIFPGSQVNGGILVAILIAIGVYILMTKTTLGYELRACGANRHAARYAGINDKRNIVLSMAIAGALAGCGAALYWLSGNTEFYWSTYQTLPTEGFNGIPVALLAANHPVGVIFTSMFMSLLNISGLQLKTLTAYNEYITDIIISAIVYMSSFSLIIKMWLNGRKKKAAAPPPKADDGQDTGKENAQ